jgi:hypothetical protein
VVTRLPAQSASNADIADVIMAESHDNAHEGDVEHRGSGAKVQKGRWESLWPVIACGAGLFSDGYLNNVRRPRGRLLHNIPWLRKRGC